VLARPGTRRDALQQPFRGGLFDINGQEDLFPSDTSPASHFTDPAHGDYPVRASSPCAQISGVGLLNPAILAR